MSKEYKDDTLDFNKVKYRENHFRVTPNSDFFMYFQTSNGNNSEHFISLLTVFCVWGDWSKYLVA